MANKKFVVNPFSIVYEQIQNDLRVMIANNNETFTDFFNDGSGSSVIDIASALGAFFAFHVIANRKEFTLEQAVNYKSLIGNAYDKGYNVSRGTNLVVNLQATPDTTGALTAWTTLGSYEEYDLTLVKDVTFQSGVPCTLQMIIGNRSTESLAVATSSISLFRFTSDDVTDTVRLFLNDSELVYSTQIKDLLNDMYLMQSNSQGSVNVFYLQAGNYKYKTGDTLTIDYIARNAIDISDVTASSFYIPGFTVTGVSEAQSRVAMQSKDDIRVKAQLHAETSGIVKARADFKKVIQEQDNSIKSINDEDIQPGRINIIVLKKDLSALTPEDISKYNIIVKNSTVSGVANLYYTNAGRYDTPLNINITSSEGISTESTLVPQILEKIGTYEESLGEFINFDDLEEFLEKDTKGIKVARVTIETPAWKKGNYQVSDTCIASTFNNKAYYVDSIIYRTGSSEPNWNAPEDGYVVDNDILWKEYNGEPEGIMVWRPNVQVALGRLVVDSLDEQKRVFECVGYVARTGSKEPEWSLGSQTLYDNQIVWSKVSPEPVTLESWSSNKLLTIGTVFKKDLNKNITENFTNTTVYNYFSEIFGGNFYTAKPLENGLECFADEALSLSIGLASNLVEETKTVTITPKTSEESKTGVYQDLTVYKYVGGVSGSFYSDSPLALGVECFSDKKLLNSIGSVEEYNEPESKVLIASAEGTSYYYKVADYAMPTGNSEPDWSDKTPEGYIEDGNRLIWAETSYPVRFLKLSGKNYAKFESNITIS